MVVGTRPEAIKMAPVVRALRADPAVETRVVFTGQHSTLVDQVLSAFDLDPDFDLGIMRPGQSLYDVVHAALDGLREVVDRVRPGMLLVQGDTASVFTGALVGFFERVRVGHVEAGLRSGDLAAPFPEEGLRRLTGVLSDVHFAPTPHARALLVAERAPADAILGGGTAGAAGIHVTGNTVVDALMDVAGQQRPITNATLRGVVESGQRLILLTAHRRESFGAPLRDLFGAVRSLADRAGDVAIVYPVHPNPNVRGPAQELLSGHPRIHLTDTLDYFDMVAALRHAALVMTDSGGIQEEAPTFGTHVLVLREVTERPEGVEAGVAELVGTDPGRIVDRALAALQSERRPGAANPYGDGRAGARIADIVVSELTGRTRTTTDWSG